MFLLLLRSTRKRRNGAPTNAVMVPVWSTIGVKSMRAAVSATVRKSAPSKKEAGRRKR